jgi:Tfp pilus assembly protein PilF
MHRSAALVSFLWILSAVPPSHAAQAPGEAKQAGQAEQDVLKRADAAFRSGFAAMQAGQLEDARTQFTQVTRLAPQIPEGHEALGEVLIELGKAGEAVAEFEAALRLKPEDPGIESNLALAYAKAGDPAKAVPQFSAALEASSQPGAQPVGVDFLQAYGRALAAVGRTAEAIPMFQSAIDKDGLKRRRGLNAL